MKKWMKTSVFFGLIIAISAQAAHMGRDLYSIAHALAQHNVRKPLDNAVRLYFADQPTPKISQLLGSTKISFKRNPMWSDWKSGADECNWFFRLSMIELQKRAREVGANAVIHIVSNYKNIPYLSATKFECHMDAPGGVAFKADFVRIDVQSTHQR